MLLDEVEIKEKPTFEESGLHSIPMLLNDNELKIIREEVDYLFSKNLMQGHGFSVFINPRRQEIPQAPSRILSVNLFEKALDVMELLKKFNNEKYKNIRLAHIAIYKEHKNPVALRWHSDKREGNLTRCQIVLRGGQEDSGAFVYIEESHKLGPNISYRPSDEYLEKNKNKIVMMNKANGTGFLINTLGYHSRVPLVSERISIMMDFVDADYIKKNPTDIGSNLLISFHQLTDRILSNINFFQILLPQNSSNSNYPDAYKFSQKFGGYYLYILKPFYIVKNFFKKNGDY